MENQAYEIETANGTYTVFVDGSAEQWTYKPGDYNGTGGPWVEEFFCSKEAAEKAAQEDADARYNERMSWEDDNY